MFNCIVRFINYNDQKGILSDVSRLLHLAELAPVVNPDVLILLFVSIYRVKGLKMKPELIAAGTTSPV